MVSDEEHFDPSESILKDSLNTIKSEMDYFNVKPSSNWKGKRLKFRYLVKGSKREGERFRFLLFLRGLQLCGIMYLRWRKRTLRLGRKEGVELSSLFKRKEGNFRKRGRRVVFWQQDGILWQLFLSSALRSSQGVTWRIHSPNVLLITIIVRST